VRLVVWGLTERHAAIAEASARRGPSRTGWNFVQIERRTDDVCPIDVRDGHLIAADARDGWAYGVYRAGHVDV
jgi:hypothetical protein